MEEMIRMALHTIIFLLVVGLACRPAMSEETIMPGIPTTICAVYPALPDPLTTLGAETCTVTVNQAGGRFVMTNGFLAAEVDLKSGVLTAVENRLTGERMSLRDDRMALAIRANGTHALAWQSDQARLEMTDPESSVTGATVRLEQDLEGRRIAVVYRMRSDWFWIERHLEIYGETDRGDVLDLIDYGKLAVEDGTERELVLGLFDRPRLATVGVGGLFAGVGWWLSAVTHEGVYQNQADGYSLPDQYTSEPWYVGVFRAEQGEPFAGWVWYKAYLHVKKEQTDRQPCYAAWNGGWGQWGLNIEDPATAPYIRLARRLGLRLLLVGGGEVGYGTPRYVELAESSAPAKDNIARLREGGLIWGCLEHGGRNEGWLDPQAMRQAYQVLNQCPGNELRAFAFDFFSAPNTYAAHRSVATYFRACRGKLDYTECHLGMAEYGPQFQREVLVNHPTDIGHDSSNFSADWCTFLNFRRSRAEFQREWNYLAPEYGMYYFLTHYSNWAHPRAYTDPEPHQLMYGPPAYCGIAYNFHDPQGFRSSVAAVAAFSPFYVFGHLDLKMPEADVAFARDYMAWVERNAELIRRARVCHEDGETCVVSKIRDGRGAIFLVNYSPGEHRFRIRFLLGREARYRQVFPTAVPSERSLPDGGELELRVAGESVAILDINQGLRGLPPSDTTRFPVDVVWEGMAGDVWHGAFTLPAIDETLKAAADPNLPRALLSLEQVGREYSGVGRGKLSPEFMRAIGMRQDNLVETWKLAPWAFGDRVWLVYRPTPGLYQADEAYPRLMVNGAPISLVPRINYLDRLACTLFYADVTGTARLGRKNTVTLEGIQEKVPGRTGLYCAAERY